jgi:hypothetical protein
MALRAIESGLLRLRWLAAATRFEIAMRRHDHALKYAYKYGFNPNQPRVPRGQPEGGQWAGDGTSSDSIRLAGDIPTGDSPEVPKEAPPTTRLRNIAIRALAARFGPGILVAAEAGSWIYDHKEEISAYFDSPKTLQELQSGADSPEKGYDIHHIVERASANENGSENDKVDTHENLVRIPRWKHWQINGYYQTESDEYGGLTPREYLKGKSWEERTRVGLNALERFGILRR